MLVSVVIPNYNHYPYLRQRIDTVINQTFSDFEVIILDDFSTDNSKEIIESYRDHPKVKTIVYNESNSGSPFIQWAKGIELAKGEYVWIAESDDWCETNFLIELMAYAVQYPDASLIYSNTLMVKETESFTFGSPVSSDHVHFSGYELMKEKLINGLSINNASAVVFKRRSALPCLPQLIWFQKHGDYFFWIQVAQGGDAVFVNQKLNYCRILETSVTRQAYQKGTQSLIEHIKIFSVLNNYIHLLRLRRKLLFYDCWGLTFMDMFHIVKRKELKKYRHELLSACKFNIYFSFRFEYFRLRKKLAF